MATVVTNPMATMTRNWWALVLRGILAVLFGVLIIVWPSLALATLILMFAAYALVDGIFAVAGALSHREQYQHWWWTLLEGLLSILVGIFAFFYPGLTAITLLYVIAFWAILTGLFEVIAAFRLRQVIHNEWLLVLTG